MLSNSQDTESISGRPTGGSTGSGNVVKFVSSAIAMDGWGHKKVAQIFALPARRETAKGPDFQALTEVLGHAEAMMQVPGISADAIISYITEAIDRIQNPHRALEQELARLVDAKTPPNKEFYKARADKSELAVAFFHRVYGRFYEAGVLYKHQLRKMDFNFYDSLSKAKGAPSLPVKKEETDKKLQRLMSSNPTEIIRLASALASRERRA